MDPSDHHVASGKEIDSMSRMLIILAAAVVAGAVAGGSLVLGLEDAGSAADTVASVPQPGSLVGEADGASTPASGARTPEAIYRSDAPAVVVITATQTEVIPPTIFTPRQTQQVRALGSGFVVDRQGDIVTNEHVIQGATAVRVGFTGGASYPAEIVGTDPSTDIAVVRVDAPASALQPLAFGDSAAVQVGDPVYAIGNPFGLDRTMTAGIVSATGRDISAPDNLTIPNAIQTDAAINHGNSGGPLLDRTGRVIGVNAQIQGGTVDANVGVGFAIPSDTARSVTDQLISSGHAEHAWLGVEIETIDPSLVRAVRGLPERGVVVVRVTKGSPAARAGLQPARQHVTVGGVTAFVGGDAIVAAGGRPVATAAELSDVVARQKPGDGLTLEVVRRGVRRTVAVTLGNVPG